MTQILAARLVGFNLDAGDLFRLERFSISCHSPSMRNSAESRFLLRLA